MLHAGISRNGPLPDAAWSNRSGQRIRSVEITRDKSVNLPAEQFRDRLEGRIIWFVEREGASICCSIWTTGIGCFFI